MAKTYTKDGIEYLSSNHRMVYDPEFHENHGKEYTVQELIYMCSMWNYMKKADISAALGRTHGSVLSKAYYLREKGEFEYFRKLGEKNA